MSESVVLKRGPGRPPGTAGTSNRQIHYACQRCGADVGKENLRSKSAYYHTIGKPRIFVRARVTEWLCVPCMEADPDYIREALSASPGMRDTRLAKNTPDPTEDGSTPSAHPDAAAPRPADDLDNAGTPGRG